MNRIFIEAIHLALENGMNYFDAANTYGPGQGGSNAWKRY